MVYAVLRHGPRVDMVYGDDVGNPWLATVPFDARSPSISVQTVEDALSQYTFAFCGAQRVAIKTSPWIRCAMTAVQLRDALLKLGVPSTISVSWALTEQHDYTDHYAPESVVKDFNAFAKSNEMEECTLPAPGELIERRVTLDDNVVLVTHGGIVPQICHLMTGRHDCGFHFYGGFVYEVDRALTVVPGLRFHGLGSTPVFSKGSRLNTFLTPEDFSRLVMRDNIVIHDKTENSYITVGSRDARV